MKFLDNLSQGQRTALMVGVPVVGGVVLLQTMRSPAPVEEDDPTAADPSGTIAGTYMPSTDAIGTGELADMFTGVTDGLIDLTQRIGDLESKPTTTPPPATTPLKRPYRTTTVRAPYGPVTENLNQIATRIRKSGTTTTVTGAPLTTGYLAHVNGLAVPVTRQLPKGKTIRY